VACLLHLYPLIGYSQTQQSVYSLNLLPDGKSVMLKTQREMIFFSAGQIAYFKEGKSAFADAMNYLQKDSVEQAYKILKSIYYFDSSRSIGYESKRIADSISDIYIQNLSQNLKGRWRLKWEGRSNSWVTKKAEEDLIIEFSNHTIQFYKNGKLLETLPSVILLNSELYLQSDAGYVISENQQRRFAIRSMNHRNQESVINALVLSQYLNCGCGCPFQVFEKIIENL
jgi:hypothetical protein